MACARSAERESAERGTASRTGSTRPWTLCLRATVLGSRHWLGSDGPRPKCYGHSQAPGRGTIRRVLSLGGGSRHRHASGRHGLHRNGNAGGMELEIKRERISDSVSKSPAGQDLAGRRAKCADSKIRNPDDSLKAGACLVGGAGSGDSKRANVEGCMTSGPHPEALELVGLPRAMTDIGGEQSYGTSVMVFAGEEAQLGQSCFNYRLHFRLVGCLLTAL